MTAAESLLTEALASGDEAKLADGHLWLGDCLLGRGLYAQAEGEFALAIGSTGGGGSAGEAADEFLLVARGAACLASAAAAALRTAGLPQGTGNAPSEPELSTQHPLLQAPANAFVQALARVKQALPRPAVKGRR